jgi:hypothetical protein
MNFWPKIKFVDKMPRWQVEQMTHSVEAQYGCVDWLLRGTYNHVDNEITVLRTTTWHQLRTLLHELAHWFGGKVLRCGTDSKYHIWIDSHLTFDMPEELIKELIRKQKKL